MRFVWIQLAFVLGCAAGAVSLARGSDVVDEADLFQAQARSLADERLAEIKREHHKEVLIETFPALSRVRSAGHNLGDGGELKRLFAQWSADRCRARHLDGVHILICKDPRYVYVGVWPPENDPLFPEEDREHLRERLGYRLGWESSIRGSVKVTLTGLARKMRRTSTPWTRSDEGLFDAIAYVDRRLEVHRPIDWRPWWAGLTWMGGFLVIWLALGVTRGKLRRRDTAQSLYTYDHYNVQAATPGAVLGGDLGAAVGQGLFHPHQDGATSSYPTLTDTARPTFPSHPSSPSLPLG